MRSGVQVGDEIITIGGIKGKIVKTKDDSIVIQVGADKVKFEMMRWSVSTVESTAKTAKTVVEEEPKKAMPKRLKKAAKEAQFKLEKIDVTEPGKPVVTGMRA